MGVYSAGVVCKAVGDGKYFFRFPSAYIVIMVAFLVPGNQRNNENN